ncbi:YczE/YyaS/YitT family protein [Agromyces subbeticus]|uniref:membrane protein YczE n=1 Tax=Agromyces subbeticus TaxID=293890 RepID=UPI0003B5662C|nr:membrane protein [Agromyces subbeticus]
MPRSIRFTSADSTPVLVRRFVQLFVGLFLYGIGIALIVRGELGVGPWDVLTQGISKHTGLGFGLITVLMSGVVLLLWIPIRQRLGFGTVMNALLVGPAADVGLWLIPSGLDLWVRIVLLASGIVVLAAATGLYIGAHFGPGPRDGLMTGLHRVTGWKIWIVRTGIELVVLAAGWLLGGNVGIGTVAFALLIGPLCGYTIPLFAIKRSPVVPSTGRADATTPEPTPSAASPA